MADNADASKETADAEQNHSTSENADDHDGASSSEDRIAELEAKIERLAGAKEDTVASRNKIKERLRETEARLAEYERAKLDSERKRLKKEQDFSSLEKTYREEIDELRREIAKRDEQAQERVRQDRRTQVLDGLMTQTKKSKAVLSGLLREAEALGNFQVPDEVDRYAVDSALRAVEALAPDLFKKEPVGTPGQPGVNTQNKSIQALPSDDQEARVIALAKNWGKPRGR